MKKATIIVVAVLAIVLSVVCLTACVGSVEGTYKFYSMTAEGLTFKVGSTYMGMFELSEDFMVFEFKNDGTCTAKAPFVEKAEIGTWTQDGKTITIVSGEQTWEATLNGDELIVEAEGEGKLILKKSK